MRCPSFGHLQFPPAAARAAARARVVRVVVTLWHHAKGNPKTTLAGAAAIAACFLPERLGGLVVGIAGGIGLILSADA